MKRSFFTVFIALALLGTAAAYAQPNRDIYHIVTTVCEDASSAVTVNYHCRSCDSYVLYTLASDTEFAQARKAWPVCQRWSSKGIGNTATGSPMVSQPLALSMAQPTAVDRFALQNGLELRTGIR